MLDIRQLAALAAVLEEQSFEKAAQKLHITQSAISQRLKQLEDKLGQTLVIRSNPIQATPAGQQVLKYFHQISMLEGELLKELSPQEETGYSRVPIGINADSLQTWFLEALEPLLSKHKLLLDLKQDDQEQTHHLLRTGEVIGCITSSPNPMQGCSCIPLGVMSYRCLASPGFLAKYFPQGINAEGFKQAPAAEFNNKDELQNRYLKNFFDIDPGDYPRHRVPSSDPYFQMIVRGFAYGMIPDQQSQPLLEQGKVVELTPGRYLAIPLYWHVWNLKSEHIQHLTQTLLKVAGQALDPFEQHPVLTHPE